VTALKETPVEMLLRAAATTATWPETPDLRARVVARVSTVAAGAPGSVAQPHPARRPTARRTAVVIALALVAALAFAGVAGALGFRLPGLNIVQVASLPPAGAGLDLGSPIPLGDARTFDGPRVLAPTTMPPPDVAYVLGTGDRRIVTLAWRASGGEPALVGSDLALTVMAIPGTLDETLVTKLLDRGSTVEPVTVDGGRGWWISGAPHELMVIRPDGTAGVAYAALVGDTLVFERDGTVYRLSSTLGRDRTVEVAESLR
jgi:hypothetical protein